ncbi:MULTISPECIES: hypothetical protein [Nocardia]|uniref:DUF732 domain-containing protein n=1 Tax=Nocardia sputorum TaxID=2984338 RepID=A0ABN6TYH5_9NOCA|nr:hypothetical protein [Nocardia sputorum]BDT96180.1 hypothetical protein IFM12275_61560 [Nocardia sputorum]BDT97940.1 hypothetical protein IFM12276_09690 [Nocardia sputorum]
MSTHQRVRTVIVALSGALVLALGSVTLLAPEAAAAPDNAPVVHVSDSVFDFDGQGSKSDDKAGKAEKLSGNVTTKLIDLVAGIIKCGLNIASPSVKCSL